MKVIYVGKELFLYLALLFGFLSYAYRVYCAFQMDDLSFINPLKHHIPEGMIFVGVQTMIFNWILGFFVGVLALEFFWWLNPSYKKYDGLYTTPEKDNEHV